MKFKCKMSDSGAMRYLASIAYTISRMSRVCVMRLTPNNVCFNVANETTPMVWVTLEQDKFFNEYTLSGKSENHNEIYMEFNTLMLAKSISSLKTSAKSAKIKLTNKQQPCLTFEIELNSTSTESRLCVHDVPISVIPQRRWSNYDAPNIPRFDVCLEMPHFKNLKGVLERLKHMSPILMVTAEQNGTLSFKVDMDTAIITSHFPDLTVFHFDQENENVSASVDIKKFLAFLGWDTAVRLTKSLCYMINDRIVNIELSLDGYLQIKYIIPAVIS